MPFLSKSTFLLGLQCSKLLWTRYNAKELIPAPDNQQQAIFDQGKEVGDWAKKLFPDGIEIESDIHDYDQIVKLTQQSLAKRKPLFEAGFQFNGGFARVDVLEPVGADKWNIVEVKSSTQVKNVNLQDVAFQAYVLAGSGLKINRCFLLHINNEYVRKGAVDPRQLFTKTEVTAEVSALSREVEDRLESMQKTIGLKQQPTINIGLQCDDPYPCPLHDRCWGFLPAHNIFTLYGIRKKKSFKLLADGVQAIDQLPDDFPLNDKQQIQKKALRTGKPYFDRAAVESFLCRLKYPIAYLDFETFSTAIPLFDDCSPFNQIPFQFSLHVVRTPNASPEHHSFLAEGRNDPRPEFLKSLKTALPSTGSIVVFNATFEKNVLLKCCAVHPQYERWQKSLDQRIIDLLQPFRGFSYYHPKQNGSASMKAVLPAMTGKGYEQLAIQEGGMASLEFLRVTFGDVADEERVNVRKQLEEYCGLDTEGMVWIVGVLGGLVY